MYIIGGTYKRKPLVSPKGLVTRPTSGRLRESLFNICQHFIDGARFLDLFAGSGAIGLEAVSRGASRAVFVDSSRESQKCIQQNIESLNVGKSCRVICADIAVALERLLQSKEQFDVIYADPPYDALMEWKGKEMTCSLMVLSIVDQGALLAPGGYLFIEESDRFQIPELQTLQLKSARRMGRSTLHQFEKIS